MNRKTGMGVELRDARIARGMTLEDAQRSTRIARRYLQALEEEDFEALPAPVFARGFLRSYSQYLGLDPTTLIDKFPGQPRPPDAFPAPGDAAPRAGARASRAATDNRYADERDYEIDSLDPIPSIDTRSPSVSLGPWLVAAFVVLVVLAGVIVIVVLGDDDAPDATPLSAPPGVGSALLREEESPVATEQEPVIRLETMPELTARTVSDAVVVLRRSGLPFVLVEIFDAAAPAGAILVQIPAVGARLDSGTTVTLTVSRGPRPSAPAQPAEGAGTPATAVPGATPEIGVAP